MLVTDVDGRGRRRVAEEEPPLGLEVVLHRRVEVEVVLAQVGEDQRGEPDPVQAPECRAVRGRLHRATPVARVEHLAEEPLEVDRLGGRPRRRAALAVDPGLDRPEQPRPAARGSEHRVEQEGGRRLPTRARHPRDLQFRGRPLEELLRRRRHRRTRVRDNELRHGQIERPLDDERDRSVLDRLRCEVVPVRSHPRHAEEERPRPGATRVVGQVANFRRRERDHLRRRERGDQALDIHDGRV